MSDSLRPHGSTASLSITNSWSSLRLASIESVMPSSHLILCHPLLLLPLIPPSIRVFSNESTLRMRWPKYWSFSIIPPKKIPVECYTKAQTLKWIQEKSNTQFKIYKLFIQSNTKHEKVRNTPIAWSRNRHRKGRDNRITRQELKASIINLTNIFKNF